MPKIQKNMNGLEKELLSTLALSFLTGIGPVTARLLIAYTGSATAVFEEKSQKLAKIPGIGPKAIQALKEADEAKRKAESELVFTSKHNIQVFAYHAPNYPQRLKQCTDAPLVFFLKGGVNLDATCMVAIVGTRNATPYGKSITAQIVQELRSVNPIIISGLAYGIDYEAHKAAIDNGLVTLGIMGTGLDTIYPAKHRSLAAKMLTANGGLLTEFTYGSKPDRENFPMRNRLIAGLCDVLVVVEASTTGGALISARLANDYNREVCAVPGRTTDLYSAGCNNLIKNHLAALVNNGSDIIQQMGWNKEQQMRSMQKSLFVELNPTEQIIFDKLQQQTEIGLDSLAMQCNLSTAQVQSDLLSLEFKGLVRQLPGKLFKRT